MSGDPAGARRIVVLGVVGAGKSSLSRRLGERLAAPVYHLDNVADRNGHDDPSRLHAPFGEQPEHPFVPRPLAERLEIAARLAAGPHWIAEGAFVEWTAELLARADTIVWLDQVRLRDAIGSVLGRVRRSQARESDRHEGAARTFRPRAYLRHGIELLFELWDVAGYFWRPVAPGVERDIRAGRWDRLSRAAIRRALEPHAGTVIHVRTADELDGLEERILGRVAAAGTDQPSASA